jgi:Gluconate 2-dehydrogenase subunit 3
MPETPIDDRYAGYDVLRKWSSPSFDDATRAVIERRLHAAPQRRFFSEAEFALLACACARLLATPVDEPPIACWIDDDLFAAGRGEGFRGPGVPRADTAWRCGLAGLEAHAHRQHGRSFVALDGAQQDATLRAVQSGEAQASDFGGLAPAFFFTHMLLKSAAAHFYAQPQAWSEIGFGGPASPRGYVRLGVGQRDLWEAALPPAAKEAA